MTFNNVVINDEENWGGILVKKTIRDVDVKGKELVK